MLNKNPEISSLIAPNDEFENYFRNTIIPQLFVDAHLILRKFTPPAMKLFRLKLTDVGRPIADIMINLRFPAIVDHIKSVIATGHILEKLMQTTDTRSYLMNIIPYFLLKENKTIGVIITFVETTMPIRDLKEQEKLIAEQEMLLDTISHDIKNPLTGLSLTIQMIKKLPEKGMEHFPELLANVESNLFSIQKVIDDLRKSRFQNTDIRPLKNV